MSETRSKDSGEMVAREFLGGRATIVIGDITQQTVDAIVNAANSTLLGGDGVDGSIHRAGGAQILEECRELRRTRFPLGLPTGESVITRGGLLPTSFVIHTVGPVWGQCAGREAELLAACYRNSLALAVSHNIRSLAFPAISTGAYSYPHAGAAAVSSAAVSEFLTHDETLVEVRFVFFSPRDAKTFVRHHKFDAL